MRKFAFILLTTLFFCACTKDELDEGGAGTNVESTEYVTIKSTFDPDNETGTEFSDLLNASYSTASYIKVTGRMRYSDLTALGAITTFKGIDLSDVAIIGSVTVSTAAINEYNDVPRATTSTHASISSLFYEVTTTGTPSLVELILPDNLSVIGASAFFGNSKLERIIFKTPNAAAMAEYANYYNESESDDVTEAIDLSTNELEFYPGAFSGCTSLKSITYQDADGNEIETTHDNPLPVSTTAIHYSAFKECSGLNELDLSECVNLEILDDQAFLSCTSLAAIDIPSSVSTIGSMVFMGCDAMTSIKTNWDPSMAVSVSSDTYPEAFMRKSPKYPIQIPDTIYYTDETQETLIDLKALFYLQTGWPYYWLTTETDPDEFKSSELLEDSFGIVSTCTVDGESDLYDQLVAYYGEDFNEKYESDGVTLRDNGTLTIGGTISAADFFYMGTFKHIDFTQPIGSVTYSLTAIYKGTYNGVEYPKDYIPEGVFENNEVLTTFNYPNAVNLKIGKRAFKGSNITKFSIANNNFLTLYAEECFMNCKSLTSIGAFSYRYDYTIEESAFEGCSSLKLTNTLNNYAGSGLMFVSGDYSATNDANLYTGLTYLGERAFYGCEVLADNGTVTGINGKTLFLPTTLEHIGEEAFAECTFAAISAMWDPAIKNMPTIPASAIPSTCTSLCVVDGAEGLYNTTEGWRELFTDYYTGSSASTANVAVDDFDKYSVHLAEGRSADMGDMLAVIQENNKDEDYADNDNVSKLNITGYLTAADISDLNEYCAQTGQGWKTIDLSGLMSMSSTTAEFLPKATTVESIIFPNLNFAIGGSIGAEASNLTDIEFKWTALSNYTNSSITSSTKNTYSVTVTVKEDYDYSKDYSTITSNGIGFKGDVNSVSNNIVTVTYTESYEDSAKKDFTETDFSTSGSVEIVQSCTSTGTFPSGCTITVPNESIATSLDAEDGWKGYAITYLGGVN